MSMLAVRLTSLLVALSAVACEEPVDRSLVPRAVVDVDPVDAPTRSVARPGHVSAEATIPPNEPADLAPDSVGTATVVTWREGWDSAAQYGPTVTLMRCELATLQCLISDDRLAVDPTSSASTATACAEALGPRCAQGQTARFVGGRFDDCQLGLPACLESYGDPVACSAVFAYCFGGGQGRFIEPR
ncbi:MAG: hypothetical protein B7733_05090 [Myxococcales bacterium FL481]|nr:MAG: hypothetical protein B7733_05090 [Myxococcales bacterium FL481]